MTRSAAASFFLCLAAASCGATRPRAAAPPTKQLATPHESAPHRARPAETSAPIEAGVSVSGEDSWTAPPLHELPDPVPAASRAPSISSGAAAQRPVAAEGLPAEEVASAPRTTPAFVELEEAPVAHEPAEDSPLSGAELALWNDPDFRRRFAESYIAETDVEPRVTSVEREEMYEILDLISADRVDEAAALLRERRGGTASAVLDFTLAGIYFQEERLDHAAAAYAVAVEKYPKFLRAWRNLALVRVRQNDYESALHAFTRVIELGGGDAVTYGLLGFSYSRVGQNLPAESAYRLAVLLDPDTLDWKLGLARSLFELERFADAAALCGDLIAAHPQRSELWLLQANAYIGLKQPLSAAENFELVDRLGHSTVESLNTLGDIYVNEELFDLAVASYVRALGMADTGGASRLLRAAGVLTARSAHAETRMLLDSIEAQRGNELGDEERKDLLKLRSRLAVADGAGEEEARVLAEIVALDPLDGEALILLGDHCRSSGDVEQSAFYYERAASLEDFEADAKLRHGQLLVAERRYAEALPLLRRSQHLKPRESLGDFLEQVERVSQKR